MAPVDPASTRRIRVTYENAINQHTFQCRVSTGAVTIDIDTVISEFLGALSGAFIASVVTAADEALLGSDIFNPLDGSLLPTTTFGGAATPTKENDATSMTFVGRGSDSHRVRVSLFGYPNALSNFRLTVAEAASIGTAIDVLTEDAGIFQTITGLVPTWKAYADIKPNDHWVKRAR